MMMSHPKNVTEKMVSQVLLIVKFELLEKYFSNIDILYRGKNENIKIYQILKVTT